MYLKDVQHWWAKESFSLPVKIQGRSYIFTLLNPNMNNFLITHQCYRKGIKFNKTRDGLKRNIEAR